MDISTVLVSTVGVALTLGLVYYGLKTFKLFKGNIAARAWTHISLSAMFFGIGTVMFLIESIAPMGLVAVGGVMETIGAFFLFLGLRKNYLFWASKDHFA